MGNSCSFSILDKHDNQNKQDNQNKPKFKFEQTACVYKSVYDKNVCYTLSLAEQKMLYNDIRPVTFVVLKQINTLREKLESLGVDLAEYEIVTEQTTYGRSIYILDRLKILYNSEISKLSA